MTAELADPYWSLVSQVSAYAVDTAPASPLLADGKVVSTITEELFYESLYAHRDLIERQLAQRLLDAIPLVCFAGGRGSGKTSTLRCVLRRLATKADVRVVLLDVKRLHDQQALTGVTAETAPGVFGVLLRQEIQAQLFPTQTESRQFLAWALSGPPDASDRFDAVVVSDLFDEFLMTTAEAEIEADSRRSFTKQLLDWFLSHHKQYFETLTRVRPLLRAAHVVQAFVQLQERIRRIILAYDNVDRLPLAIQPRFVEMANDQHLNAGGSAATVVAIRTENLHGEKPPAGAGGDVFVRVGAGDNEYPCMLLPQVTREHVTNVLQLRHDFCAKLSAGAIAASREAVTLAHGAVVSELLDHSVWSLANDSIRMVNAVYSGFLQYLNALAIRFRDTVNLSSRDGHVQTLFFLWLREHGAQHEIHVYDILKGARRRAHAGEFANQASEHHLLLTSVLNAANHPSLFSAWGAWPQFSVVAAKLRDLGFDLDDLRMAMAELVAPIGEPLRSLELQNDATQPLRLQWESATRVRLTPLGMELLSNIFHKVGYVWTVAGLRQSPPVDYLNVTVGKRIQVLLDYICVMAKRHLGLMAVIPEAWRERYPDGWLDQYRADFGVRRQLQVERILQSASRFYAPSFAGRPNPFVAVSEAYQELLSQVGRGRPLRDLPLDELDRVAIGGAR